MTHKFSIGFTCGEFPTKSNICNLLCNKNFHHFRCVTEGQDPAETSWNHQFTSFPTLQHLVFEELKYVVVNALFLRLASDTIVIKVSPKRLYLQVLHKIISMGIINLLFGWSLKVLTSMTCAKKWFSSLKRAFLQCCFAQPNLCTYFPHRLFFFHCFTLNCDMQSDMGRLHHKG